MLLNKDYCANYKKSEFLSTEQRKEEEINCLEDVRSAKLGQSQKLESALEFSFKDEKTYKMRGNMRSDADVALFLSDW